MNVEAVYTDVLCSICHKVKLRVQHPLTTAICRTCITSGRVRYNRHTRKLEDTMHQEDTTSESTSTDISAPSASQGDAPMPATIKKDKEVKPKAEKKVRDTLTGYITELILAGEEDTDKVVQKAIAKYPGTEPKKAKSLLYVRRSILKKQGKLK